MSDDIRSLTDMVVEFCTERDWDRFHNPKDLAIGISTEAGELLDLFRFKDLDECDRIKSSSEVSDELADVLFFVIRFAHVCDIDLAEALSSKIGKNALKYPVDRSKGSNKKYDEL